MFKNDVDKKDFEPFQSENALNALDFNVIATLSILHSAGKNAAWKNLLQK